MRTPAEYEDAFRAGKVLRLVCVIDAWAKGQNRFSRRFALRLLKMDETWWRSVAKAAVTTPPSPDAIEAVVKFFRDRGIYRKELDK